VWAQQQLAALLLVLAALLLVLAALVLGRALLLLGVLLQELVQPQEWHLIWEQSLVLVLAQARVLAQQQLPALLLVLAPPLVLAQAQEWGRWVAAVQQQQAVAAPALEQAVGQPLAVALAQ
jgi:hypothetical protein